VDDPRNHRIRLVGCGEDAAATANAVVEMARSRGYGKIWGFVAPDEWNALRKLGFRREGMLDGFLPDRHGVGIARYLHPDRARSARLAEEDAIVEQALAAGPRPPTTLDPAFTVRLATPEDCDQISRLLTTVFESYPTPIETGADILRAMAQEVHFALAEHQGRLVSVASADVDREHRVAEMTDCATLPEYRGRGLMQALLSAIEGEMRALELRGLFTLARATSVGINIAFARLGYRFRGRFINNCHIAGGWEDMNIWSKPLLRAGTHADASEATRSASTPLNPI
jgi:putative beta-lysine N-acetyltransferase